jgi:RHS repeat-associated protein
MASMSLSGVVQVEYDYNALGQQVIRRLTQAGQTIHSLHDLDGNRIAEYDYDDVAGTSSLIREYVWMNGQVVAVIEGGAVYYVRTDHIGRPVFATNGSGTKVWDASYLPFGGVHTSSGSNIDLRFPGQWFQSEAGLQQNWMRDYDPTLGRYIQADPLGLVDGASVYNYALQNPGRYVDPRGERCYSYSLPDGNTGIRCTGGSTYNPSGAASLYSPASNIRDPWPELEECKKSCLDEPWLEMNSWIGGTRGACALPSIYAGLLIGNPYISFPYNSLVTTPSCREQMCAERCIRTCNVD